MHFGKKLQKGWIYQKTFIASILCIVESLIAFDFISRENVKFALFDALHPVPDVGGLTLDDLQLPAH